MDCPKLQALKQANQTADFSFQFFLRKPSENIGSKTMVCAQPNCNEQESARIAKAEVNDIHKLESTKEIPRQSVFETR